MVAAWLSWTGLADEVWLVPVFRHAFQGQHDKSLAPFALRVAWCEALARDVGPGVAVVPVEAELPVPSYTIDALRHLRARHPEHHFRLVVGADVVGQVPRWRQWEDIAAEFAPIVVGRQGHRLPPDDGTMGEVMAVDFPAVSSTEIRSRLRRGQPTGHLLTRSVAALLQTTDPSPAESR